MYNKISVFFNTIVQNIVLYRHIYVYYNYNAYTIYHNHCLTGWYTVMCVLFNLPF